MGDVEEVLLRLVKQFKNVVGLVVGLFDHLIGDANEFALDVLLYHDACVVFDVRGGGYAGGEADELGFPANFVEFALFAQALRYREDVDWIGFPKEVGDGFKYVLVGFYVEGFGR